MREKTSQPTDDYILPARQLIGTRAEVLAQILEPALIPERVMVCMSSNTLAPRVIRTGARIAGRLGSWWYAVYVETPSERGDRINLEMPTPCNRTPSWQRRLAGPSCE